MWPASRLGSAARSTVRALQLAGAGLAGPWALGVLLLVAYAAADVGGPSTVISVILAGLSTGLAALCHVEMSSRSSTSAPGAAAATTTSATGVTSPPSCRGWSRLLGHVTALATCARTVSAAMDYISAGRSQQWVSDHLGSLPHTLGGASPDVVALGVTAVPSLLFALGLEQSCALRLVLNVSVAASIMFLVVVGVGQTDLENWSHHSFMAAGWPGC